MDSTTQHSSRWKELLKIQMHSSAPDTLMSTRWDIFPALGILSALLFKSIGATHSSSIHYSTSSIQKWSRSSKDNKLHRPN
jgi:hypothetical protein